MNLSLLHGRRITRLAVHVALAVLLVGGWELAAAQGWIDPFYVSRPGAIGGRVREWFASGTIWPHLRVTATEALLALVLGLVLGLAAGFLCGRSRTASALCGPYLKVLNSLPRVVLAPLFLIWFGLGIWSKVAFGVTLVFFVVFFNVYQGVRDVDPALVEHVRMLGAGQAALLRHVYLPSALTWVFSSLHAGVGFALVGAVVGEYLGAAEGVGYLISQAEGVLDTTGVFAGMAVLSALVMVIDVATRCAERRLLRWKP
ncbi:ABC transporter permease [Streptoverticillium reticulum]|uniref:ABC transporter permease n=1 Tax=Streptoverticillium reticulum TaxID=1433415 RepID=UPI0039BF68A1